MRTFRFFALLACAASLNAQTVDVGTGAPDTQIAQQFVNAFFRGGFSNTVVLPPLGSVRRFGTTGYIQEFQDANKNRYALVKPNAATPSVEGVPDVFQVQHPLYDYYSSVGVGTAGFPVTDTAQCPNQPSNFCYWQLFDKKFALFAFTSAPVTGGGTTFTVKDPFYTEWSNASGILTMGPALSAETAVTSPAGTQATVQTFQNALIANITSGTLNGRLVSVRFPVFQVYAANGGATGFLGLPTGPEIIVGTRRRQVFEGGAIEYEPGQSATLRLPVATVNLSSSTSTLRLKLNETFSVEAIMRAANGDILNDRVVSWVTTNGRVVSIQANGRAATLKAVGGGVATVTAVSEGKISAAIAVSVQAPCCQIGEGAPNAVLSQAFADAVTRNRLTLQLPGPNPVRRIGSGYLQEFLTGTGQRVVLALADRSPQAWVVAGPVLTRFEESGGAAGAIGYPLADQTPGGRQLFEGAALAGTPVQVVTGAILTRWAALGYETGSAGAPAGPPVPFSTFAASAGVMQSFREGLIVHIQTGSLPNRALLVTGRIARRYLELGGPGGKLGAPLTEEVTISGIRRQDFEGGHMEYPPGGEVVNVVENERRPTVSALPSSAVAGSRIRLAAGGFPDNAALRVSVSGQPDFNVRVRNGAYSWDAWVPADSPSRTVTVTAIDTASNLRAETTYTIRAAADARPNLTIVRGDGQSGAPGTRLPIPLRVNLKDERGNPLVGVSVVFNGSPGAEVDPKTASTDINGDAETFLRLPGASGTALATAEAARRVVTFQVRATGTSSLSVTRLPFDGNSYVGAAAAILKFYQDRGELATATAPVTAAGLETYLRNFCVLDPQANQICDGYLADPETANLWRLNGFAGGALELVPVAPVDIGIREALAGGSPVLLSLSMPGGTAAAVVATAVTASGDLQVVDSHPRQPRNFLSEFVSAGGKVVGALRMVPRAPAASGFLFTARSGAGAVTGAAGGCGPAFTVPSASGGTNFSYCDGAQPVYQAEITSDATYRGSLTDLAPGGPKFELNGLRTGVFRVSRPNLNWELAPLETSFQATGILNAASFVADFAPGTAISVFGFGLAKTDIPTTVEIGGRPAALLFATPFQLNAAIPIDLPPGSWPLRIQSAFGTAEAQIEVRDVAPAVFRLSPSQAAVTNQDNSLNAPNNPAPRGQAVIVYGTGFGSVQETSTALRPASTPVSARIAGVALNVVYAGLTPGAIGLYQINIQLPLDLPPGLFQSLEISQGGVTANPVPLAIR